MSIRPLLNMTVYGEARPQGSKRAFVRNGRAIVVNDCPATKSWRQEIATEAERLYADEPYTGPVYLELHFVRPRPKGHYGSGKNASVLKAAAPQHPTTKPDTVKLARAVEDALTGIVWRDDSQVVDHRLRKLFGDTHRTEIGVYAIEEEKA